MGVEEILAEADAADAGESAAKPAGPAKRGRPKGTGGKFTSKAKAAEAAEADALNKAKAELGAKLSGPAFDLEALRARCAGFAGALNAMQAGRAGRAFEAVGIPEQDRAQLVEAVRMTPAELESVGDSGAYLLLEIMPSVAMHPAIIACGTILFAFGSKEFAMRSILHAVLAQRKAAEGGPMPGAGAG